VYNLSTAFLEHLIILKHAHQREGVTDAIEIQLFLYITGNEKSFYKFLLKYVILHAIIILAVNF